ncbi:MAG: PEP-CTERM sorting domain-containing protein [Gemmataceae bacterium]|nr:PEP-CTERM sorting domain-containing protein [Gemmataceae bacterium]
MKRLSYGMLTGGGVLMALWAAAAPVQAGLIPVRVSVMPDGGYYRFTYAIVLPSDALLRPGDYFTIYDFDGFVPGSDHVGGTPYAGFWSFSTANIGPTPPGVLPDDDSGIPNLTWTYHGPVLGAVQTGLGNFWALSIYPDTKESWFTARTGTVSGRSDHNITPTTVPTPKAPPPPPPPVPEPATWLLAALGLPVIGWLRRR